MNQARHKFSYRAATLACAITLLSGSLIALAHASQGYHLAKRVMLGGQGFWDYFAVEPGTGRIFIPHGDKVLIYDSAGTKLTEVGGFKGAHAITFAPKLKLAFVSDDNFATFLRTDTNAIQQRVDLGENGPDAILYDPATERVFGFGEKGAAVIDAKAGKLLTTIPLDGKPEFAQADGSGNVFVNIEDKSEIAHLDSKQMKVVETWPIAPCKDPSGLAIDVNHKRLYAGCRNQLMVAVDYTAGKVLGTAPICKGTDASTYDSGTQTAFASCGDGTITAVREVAPHSFGVVQTMVTERGARTMALDQGTHNVYTITAKMGPPPPATAANPHPYPSIIPETFVLLIYKR